MQPFHRHKLILSLLVSFIGWDNSLAQDSSYLKVSEKLVLRGLLHARYQHFEEDSKNNGFDIRRVRLDFRGDVAAYIGYRLQIELAGSPKILDAVFIYKPFDYLQINVGQSKHPFCFDNLKSPWTLSTMSRTQLDNALAFRENDLYGNQNGRDIGIWITGKTSLTINENKRPFLDYTIGVYNGSGINVTDNNKRKDVGGALGISPVKDLWLFGRFYSGAGRTTLAPDINTNRTRFGGNVSYTSKEWLLEAEYLSATDKNDTLGVLKRNGYYLTLGYTPVPGMLQILVRLDNYDLNAHPISKGNIINKYILAGNWFFTKNTRIQLEYNFMAEESNPVDNNVFAIQFQAGF